MRSRILSLLCVLTVALCSVSGCAGDPGKTPKTGDVLTVFNYSEYLDPEMLELFTKETGIEVKYEEATTPEELYTKYKSGGISYDLVCSSD